MKKYVKCWKCGFIGYIEGELTDIMCCAPVSYRTSGICGGSYIEITEEEYNQYVEKNSNKL